MTVHIEHPDYTTPKCGNWEAGIDTYDFEGTPADCIKCLHFDEVQAEWEKYVAKPVRFGPDTPAVRTAEHDAFFEAAFIFLEKKYPF